MPNSQRVNGFETYTIYSEDDSSQMTCVPERGGTLSSLIMPGHNEARELLFLHENFWDKHIDDLPGGLPFAFPVFARLERNGQRGAYLYEGQVYQLPIHGFAWQEPWQIKVSAKNRLCLRLKYNERTLAQYPFQFEVVLDYEIRRGQLLCHQTYSNIGHKPLPYSAGFHPYFLTPPLGSGKEDVQLDYRPVRHFLYNKALTDLIGEGSLFSLPRSIMDKNLNEQLTQVAEDKDVVLHYPEGDKIHLCAAGVEDENLFPYVQLYTIPDKPFFCVEPITSVPNALNTVSGMRWLAPGQSEHGLFVLQLINRESYD